LCGGFIRRNRSSGRSTVGMAGGGFRPRKLNPGAAGSLAQTRFSWQSRVRE